jgi:predicted Zn finger-like uncharacterized protein
MSDQTADLTCKHCGQAFSVFLSEMAKQNSKITCPKCGKANEGSSEDIGGQARQKIRKEKESD